MNTTDKKIIIISACTSLALVLLGFAFFGRPVIVEKGIVEKTYDRITGKPLGAIPGTSVESNVFTIGGVDNYYYKSAMNSATLNGGVATGTVCVFPLPAASTTLVDYSASLTSNAPTTTSLLALYYTIGGYGTSTTKAIGGISDTIAANGRLMATSTGAGAGTSTISASRGILLQGSGGGDNGKNFLIFDLQGGSSPFVGSGTCRVHLREL